MFLPIEFQQKKKIERGCNVGQHGSEVLISGRKRVGMGFVMREIGFYWCKQCEVPLKPGLEADFCPDCNSSLIKGKLVLDMRKLVVLAIGLSLMIQYPFVLGSAVIDLFRPMPYGIVTLIQVMLSTIFFISGIVVVGIVRILKMYPFFFDFDSYEETNDIQLGFRTQIARSGAYFVILIPILYMVVSLLALYIGMTLEVSI